MKKTEPTAVALNSPAELLPVPEAARFLSVSVRTIYRLAAQGMIPVVRVPGARQLFFDVADLRARILSWKEAR